MLQAVGRVGTNWLNDTRMPDSARSLTADWGGLVKEGTEGHRLVVPVRCRCDDNVTTSHTCLCAIIVFQFVKTENRKQKQKKLLDLAEYRFGGGGVLCGCVCVWWLPGQG